MRLRGVAESCGVVALALLLTAALTYPLLFNPSRLARVNTDDGMFSIWVVSWVAHALTSEPQHLFDANIYYPAAGTLAFSEANLVAGALGTPVWALTHNPFLTHNAVVALSFVGSFAGMYYLTRYLTGDRGAAAVTAVLFAFCPFVFARTAHIQLLMIGLLPWCLLACHRLLDRPTVGRSVALGGALSAQALACGYYGIFAGLMVGAASVFLGVARGLWRSRDHWIGVALAAFVAIALTLPFFVPYMELHRDAGFGRSLADARDYSANARAWLASSAWAHRWWLSALGPFNEVLFPGIAATVLGVAGFWRGLRRTAATTGPPRDVVWLYAGLALVAFWASFGPAAGLYTLLFDTVPAFEFLRAPARLGIVTTLALVVLSGVALASWPRVTRRLVPLLCVLALVTAELTAAPLRMYREAPPVSRVYRVLRKQPPGPVAEFPYFEQKIQWSRHAYYMLQSTAHWHPLVNGYSDYIPPAFIRDARTLSTFPSRGAFAVLQRLGARYVVVHLNFYDSASRARLLERLQIYGSFLKPIVQDQNEWLLEITSWPPP